MRLTLTLHVTFFCFAFANIGYAQTGPAGVGSSTNNRLWVMADQDVYTDAGVTLASNGESIRQWSDLSGNSNHLSQSSASNRPTLTTNQINGHAVLSFDGTSHYLDGSVDGTITLSSMFVVGNFAVTDQTNFDYLVNIGSNYSDGISISRNTSEQYYSYTEGSLRNGPVLNTASKMFHQEFTASTPFHFLRINGTSQSVTAHGAQISIGSNIRVGAMLIGGVVNALQGNVAEIIFFNTNLNTTQRILIENYLDAKYALGQSSDKFAYQATHPGEVAGIGQESASDNHTDAQGSSIVRITGATDLEDGEYLLWGHNNAGTGNNGTEIPTEYSASGGLRLDQEWRFDLSGGDGSVGSVDITFDMTGIGFGINPANYQILTDADGNFSNASVNSSITASVNGNLITFNDVTLSGDGFFTIGNSNEAEECFSIFSDTWQGGGWICSITPDSTVNALISDGTTITVSASTSESINDLTVEGPSGSLVVASGATLVVKGDFTVDNGASVTFGTDATLIFRGTNGAQTFTNNSGSAISLYNLTINNTDGVTVTGGSLQLQNGLTLTNGNLTNSGTFTFLSDATRTAHVNAVPNGSLLSGTYNVQRFVGARDAGWNGIATSGVNTDIEDLDGEIYISNISGADGTALDQNGQPFTSMWFWDATTDAYDSPASTSDAFEVGRGYETWLADDISSWNAQAWELSGTIDMSPVSLTINSAGSRENLLGNPYPAFLDFTTIAAAAGGGIDNDEYWYYDANSASYVSVSGAGAMIPPGQGFWVITSGITELNIDPATDLLSDENASTFFKNINQREELKVHLLNENNQRFGSAVYLRKDATAFVGKDDRDINPLRLADPRSCHLVIENGADQSMVNYVPTHEPVLEIPLHVESGMAGDYSINVEGIEAFNEYQCINLVNETTGEQTSMDGKSGYKFTIGEALKPVNLKLVLSKDDYEYCESPAGTNNNSPRNLEISTQAKVIFVDFYLDRGANAQIEIYNMLGERVYQTSETVGYSRKSIDLGTAETGVYFVNVSLNGTITTDKIILK